MTQTTLPEMAEALRTLAQSEVLKTLESLLAAQNAFNLFDAIGVSNQELRHSDFLAFLLRPHEAHGLGDAFLKWFLHHALAHSPAPPIAPAALAQWDLSDANVGREPDNIDLFITSARNRLAIIIENKIRTGEHSDQLSRYLETAKAQGHGGSGGTLLGVYLTPHGGKSSHADYLPIGYEAVCAHLEKLCKTNAFANATSPDVETTIRHYTRMLRSQKIVGDPEIAKLCRALYADHQAAFDRVFDEVRNKSRQQNANFMIDSLIKRTPDFVWLNSTVYKGVSYTHFAPLTWANESGLVRKNPNERNLYLQIETYPNGQVDISGMIPPCSPKLQQRLIRLVQKYDPLWQVSSHSSNSSYLTFYRYTLRDVGSASFTDEELAKAWNVWATNEGPRFTPLVTSGDFPADAQSGDTAFAAGDDKRPFLYPLALKLLDAQPEIELAKHEQACVRFNPSRWYNEPNFPLVGDAYKKGDFAFIHMLFGNWDKRTFSIRMSMGAACDTVSESMRQKFYDRTLTLTVKHGVFLRRPLKTRRPGTWDELYVYEILRGDDLNQDETRITNTVNEKWAKFLADDYPVLASLIKPGDFPAA